MNHLLSAPLQQFYQQWRAVINDSHPEVDGIWTGLRLVGGIPTHLKNMTSSVGMMTFPIYGKIKAMFQTTNQEKKLSNMGIFLYVHILSISTYSRITIPIQQRTRINRVILLDLHSILYVIFSIMAVAKSTGTMDLPSPWLILLGSLSNYFWGVWDNRPT